MLLGLHLLLFALPVQEETALNDLESDFAADDQERGLLGVAVAALAHAYACSGVWGLGGLGDLVVYGRGVREAGDAGVTLLQVLGGTDGTCPAWACCTLCACWPGAGFSKAAVLRALPQA